MKKKIKHRPPQITLSGLTTYFVTSRTYGGIPHLAGDERKSTFKEILFQKAEKFSTELKNWILFSNHYHLLAELEEGRNLSDFIQELHGGSSFAIKRLPISEILNEEQVVVRSLTPMEERNCQRIEELWRRLKPATTTETEMRRLKSAVTEEIVAASFSSRNQDVIASFSSHLELTLKDLNFSEEVWRKLKFATTTKILVEALERDNFLLFKTLILSNLPDIPFWYSYFSHVIRDEQDYFRHFNYICQNPIKHGLAKNVWDYKFSGVSKYEKDYVLDALRKYPIVDFGGSYD